MDLHHKKKGYYEKLRIRFDWNSCGKILVYSILAGFLAGLLAIAVYGVLQFLQTSVKGVYSNVGIVLPAAADYSVQDKTTELLPLHTFNNAERRDDYFGFILPRYWILIILVPMFGGLLCGLTVYTFEPEAVNEGCDSVIKTFHFRDGIIHNRLPLTKIIAGFFTLGTGGSAGRESLLALLGGGVVSSLAQRLHLNIQDRRTLMLAGVAGGIGAVLQTPIGGALFAVEILYASIALEFSAFIPCVIASTVGFFTFRTVYSEIWFLHLPKSVGIHHLTDLFFFAVFLPLVAFGGLLFSHLLNEFRNRFFRRSPLPDFLKPALGGGLVGCVALLCPQILGGGYDYLPKLLEGDLPFLLMLWLILPKMLATVLTVSSGGSGGLLVPSLFIGGCIGGVLGCTVQSTVQALTLPVHAPDLSTCILIGMSAFYAGIGKLPFAAAVIVCEIGGFGYTMLVPLLILNLLQLAIQPPRVSLYEEQVLTPLDSEAHFGNFSADLLKSISVKGLMRENLLTHFPTIPESATIPQTVKLIAAESDTLFPVVDVQGVLTGILMASDVWTAFRSRKKWAFHTAKVLSQDFRTMQIIVSPDDDLYTALRVCTLWQVSAIPVIDAEQCRLLGMLRRDTIIAAYNARLATVRWE